MSIDIDKIRYPSIHSIIIINSHGKITKKIRGWLFKVKETIGQAIINPRGIAKCVKKVTIE